MILKEEFMKITNMSIPEIFNVMHQGKINNDAKVSLHIRNGIRFLCIHKRWFDSSESAVSYLREDARNIVSPENREKLKLLAV